MEELLNTDESMKQNKTVADDDFEYDDKIEVGNWNKYEHRYN